MPKEFDSGELERYLDLKAAGHTEYDARTLARHQNVPMPDVCPECGGELEAGSGYVGELVLHCPKCGSIVWEDSEGAIRRVL